MVSEDFLCWGGQWLLFPVGLKHSLYGDAPPAQMSKLERQDRIAEVGASGREILIFMSTCSCCHLQSFIYSKKGEQPTEDPAQALTNALSIRAMCEPSVRTQLEFKSLPKQPLAKYEVPKRGGSCLGSSCKHHRWAVG